MPEGPHVGQRGAIAEPGPPEPASEPALRDMVTSAHFVFKSGLFMQLSQCPKPRDLYRLTPGMASGSSFTHLARLLSVYYVTVIVPRPEGTNSPHGAQMLRGGERHNNKIADPEFTTKKILQKIKQSRVEGKPKMPRNSDPCFVFKQRQETCHSETAR